MKIRSEICNMHKLVDPLKQFLKMDEQPKREGHGLAKRRKLEKRKNRQKRKQEKSFNENKMKFKNKPLSKP
jgi:hypothetical protein